MESPERQKIKIAKVILNIIVVFVVSFLVYLISGLLLHLLVSLLLSIPVLRAITIFILIGDWSVYLASIFIANLASTSISSAINRKTNQEDCIGRVIAGSIHIVIGVIGIIYSLTTSWSWGNLAIIGLGAMLIMSRKI